MCDALETRPQSSGTVQVPQPFTEFFDDAIVIFHNWGTYLYSARTDKHGLHSVLLLIDTADTGNRQVYGFGYLRHAT